MKKVSFALLAILLLSIYAQGQEQSDFHGSWVFVNNDGDRRELTITGYTFTIVYTPSRAMVFNPFLQRLVPNPPQRVVLEIFSWESITNNDPSTREAYPSGFLFGLRAGFANETMKLLMHRNRAALIVADNPQLLYIREGIPAELAIYFNPRLGFDRVLWGASSADVIRAYSLNPRHLLITGNIGMSQIRQFNISHQIKLRTFQFIDDQLMAVVIEYNYDVDPIRLQNTLSERYGTALTRVGEVTTISFNQYMPYLSIDILVGNNESKLIVFYQWRELSNIWEERFTRSR